MLAQVNSQADNGYSTEPSVAIL